MSKVRYPLTILIRQTMTEIYCILLHLEVIQLLEDFVNSYVYEGLLFLRRLFLYGYFM